MKSRLKVTIGIWIFLAIIITACQPQSANQIEKPSADLLHSSVKNLTDIIVHDIFSPPVASRIYAYPNIAAYEAIASMDANYNSLSNQLNGLEKLEPPSDTNIVSEIAAIEAFNTVGKALIFSTDKMEAFVESQNEEISNLKIPNSVLKSSKAYGIQVANHILDWANKDNYKETRSFPKYTIKDDPSTWKPTPPSYMEGIEPHWRKIRTFVIDSANQFTPELPTEFDLNKGSQFYEELVEVYEVVKNADEEEIEIAAFWDCNPFVMNLQGHMMFATKKITPGGHWIGITEIACRQDSADFARSTHAYTLTSIALADGFISCWDEKYRSNLVRPETVINENIDPDWIPTLQTPPFPEYTSGHSVISSAAAIVLTSVFGDDFAFEDTVELEFGLPVRKFNSFIEASEEAAISRLYGGIHYRPAIEDGVTQGRALGRYILENISFQ